MMLDADVVVVSPSSTYRVLKTAGLMRKRERKKSKKGSGFNQPSAPHKHWHIDVSYLNICGTFYYFCGILDGYSRYIVHWEIRQSMTDLDIEIIIERAREKFPDTTPRIISDNGKLERFHGTLKQECIRPQVPSEMLIIRSVDQTEAGFAGAQPARDSRLVFDRITIGG